MARKTEKRSTGGDSGAKVPSESAELGEIVTAARSTMEAKSYESGYPEPPLYLHARNGGAKK